jgi:poly(3-hydroxybutyrate) depolymerase
MLFRIIKFSAAFCAGLVAVFVLGFVALKSYGDANYFPTHDSAAPLHPEVSDNSVITEPVRFFGADFPRNFRRTPFSIEGRPGDRIPCIMTQPVEFEGRLPVILFVHGSGQDKRFVESITTPFNEAGFMMVSYDQLGRGERRVEGGRFEQIRTGYGRGGLAVDDARRIVDYLLTRDDVDPDRIYYVGVSYGAMVGTHVLAQDKRFAAGVLIVGGGDFRVMADAPLIRENLPRAVHVPLRSMARWLGGPFDPIRSAPYTGPVPILMQCGSDDRLVSPESGEALFAALSEPKEILWYDIDHPGLRDGDGPEIARMLDDGLIWLADKAGMDLELGDDSLPGRSAAAAFQ